MYIALNSKGKRTLAKYAKKDEFYTCPVCGGKVTLKRGKVTAAHFSHISGSCDDMWHYDLSEWRRSMQQLFSEKYREIPLKKDGVVHRADVLKDGIIIEFQHSPISAEEFQDRNNFYTALGYKVVWILNLSEDFEKGNLEYIKSKKSDTMLKWKNPREFLRTIIPKDNRKDISIYICMSEEEDSSDIGWVYKVIWASQDDDGTPNYNYIIHCDHCRFLEKDMDVKQLIMTKKELMQHYLSKFPDYDVKKVGIKGYSRNHYVCPKTNKFGVKCFGDGGCVYCRHCICLESIFENENKGYNVYCRYPNFAYTEEEWDNMLGPERF